MTETSIPSWPRAIGWVLSGSLSVAFIPSIYLKIVMPSSYLDRSRALVPFSKRSSDEQATSRRIDQQLRDAGWDWETDTEGPLNGRDARD